MTKEMNLLTNEEIQQQYCERVQMFFKQVEKWLPNHLEMIESIPGCLVTDATGTYHVGMVGIYEKEVPKPDGFVANILPFGVITLSAEAYVNWLKHNKIDQNWGGQNKNYHNLSFGEGILEIGAFSQEALIYFRRNTLPLIEYQSGVFQVFSQTISSDGWYWLGNPISSSHVTLVTNEQLFKLINMVNYYE